MDKGISNILCTKVDEHAGDWPSESFLGLFRIAKKCVEPKMTVRPEIDEVSPYHCVKVFKFLYNHVPLDFPFTGIPCDQECSSLCRARAVQEKEMSISVMY